MIISYTHRNFNDRQGDAGNDVIIGGGMPDDVSALAKGTLYTDMDYLYGDANGLIIVSNDNKSFYPKEYSYKKSA